jgi:hypothetical protein
MGGAAVIPIFQIWQTCMLDLPNYAEICYPCVPFPSLDDPLYYHCLNDCYGADIGYQTYIQLETDTTVSGVNADGELTFFPPTDPPQAFSAGGLDTTDPSLAQDPRLCDLGCPEASSSSNWINPNYSPAAIEWGIRDSPDSYFYHID